MFSFAVMHLNQMVGENACPMRFGFEGSYFFSLTSVALLHSRISVGIILEV